MDRILTNVSSATSIASFSGGIYTWIINSPLFLSVPLITLGGTGGIILFYLAYMRNKSEVKNNYKEYFTTIKHLTKVVVSENSRFAKYYCTAHMKCRKSGATIYYARLSPGLNFSKIDSSSGEIEIKNNVGGKDVLITLPHPLYRGDEIVINISADLIDIFPEKQEYWAAQKYYDGKDAIQALEIHLHPSRKSKTRKAEIIIGDDYINTLLPEEKLKQYTENDNEVLYVESKLLKVGNQLQIAWEW